MLWRVEDPDFISITMQDHRRWSQLGSCVSIVCGCIEDELRLNSGVVNNHRHDVQEKQERWSPVTPVGSPSAREGDKGGEGASKKNIIIP